MQYTNDPQLVDTVRQLGALLGDTIAAELGAEWLEKIELVRKNGRNASQGNAESEAHLKALFANANDHDLHVIARAFAHFLTLANIAEQEFLTAHQPMNRMFDALETLQQNTNSEEILKAIKSLEIDLVLTAHPTEVTRRTLIHKHSEIARQLRELRIVDENTSGQRKAVERIANLIAQAWHTQEIRSVRPTPVDEARWGLAVIENSLWEAVPDFLRELDDYLLQAHGERLDLGYSPLRFSSWMGGDRDGNPFVTAQVTQEVLLLGRHRAAKLFAEDIKNLIVELSMRNGNGEIAEATHHSNEPYRELLRPLLSRLQTTAEYTQPQKPLSPEVSQLNEPCDLIRDKSDLLQPLELCYRSLCDTGLSIVANGLLLDTIRRVQCFGTQLLRLDIRQDSGRHLNTIAELTRFLGLGDYASWDEQEKQSFLLRELASKRPLIPASWTPSAEVQEVLDTTRVIAANDRHMFGIYIISMASQVSDVLAVQLLLKEAGVDWHMPVAPLFETLEDLNHSPEVIAALFANDWYRGHINARQYVMIGYSDSAKDAGALAAGWAQYQAQESLVKLAAEHGIRLTLFHGRGGTVGRGGLPAKTAIYSQPPGTLEGGFRVTEQGETIRYKFGMPALAKRSLSLYAEAMVEAMTNPPPRPKDAWREIIQSMADLGRDNYRAWVKDNESFVDYFRTATPEQELGKLPLGSRPAKRRPGGIESLRAIPWIFAWAQTRLVLPAWLGVMAAITDVEQHCDAETLTEMLREWPFFRSRLSMLHMVFQKAAPHISELYDERLVSSELRKIGTDLRKELVTSLGQLEQLMERVDATQLDVYGKESMQIRSDYLYPVHLMQIEFLSRLRAADPDSITGSDIELGMMVTIIGIAIGLRNTG